jgi:hypothetical protein
MDHLEPVRRRIRAAPISEPPPPWKRIGDHSVGGLTEVGFSDDSDLLLVVSWNGRGVFDCRSGERVARDPTPPDESWYYGRQWTTIGIGPLAGREIRLSGLRGGGLSRCGRDGWLIEAVTLDWPVQSLLLMDPWGSIYDGSTRITKLMLESEVRAFGFSDTGDTLIIATSSDLTIYRLQDESPASSQSMTEK